ncbi:hypothetical protein V8G54_001350 [Vigna mungo]|uniref:Uncharacterized protein n=1 Tax=Vigna mungo TaxID=3915 RepID=A0AAQ3P872_VIGMU
MSNHLFLGYLFPLRSSRTNTFPQSPILFFLRSNNYVLIYHHRLHRRVLLLLLMLIIFVVVVSLRHSCRRCRCTPPPGPCRNRLPFHCWTLQPLLLFRCSPAPVRSVTQHRHRSSFKSHPPRANSDRGKKKRNSRNFHVSQRSLCFRSKSDSRNIPNISQKFEEPRRFRPITKTKQRADRAKCDTKQEAFQTIHTIWITRICEKKDCRGGIRVSKRSSRERRNHGRG